MIIIGLDMSLRSPGFSATNTCDGTWTIGCLYLPNLKKSFPQASSDVTNIFSVTDSVEVIIYPRISNADPDIKRYDHIVKSLGHFIRHVNATDQEEIRMYIEGYAFVHKFAGSDYKTKELTGIVKYALRYLNPISVPITTWRKVVSGSGKMTKTGALQKVAGIINLDLVALLGTSDSPAHDIADAMCIALYGKMQLGISKQSAISVED